MSGDTTQRQNGHVERQINVNQKSATALSTSEMQLRLALALVILGFEERVEQQTRQLLETERAMQELESQREALLLQRKQDIDYLAASMRQLYPDLSLTLSKEGRVEIPSSVLQQLQQLRQGHEPALVVPTSPQMGEQVRDVDISGEPPESPSVPQGMIPPPVIRDEAQKEADIDPRAKAVLVYMFSLPQASVLDWRATIAGALDLPEPPKMRSHSVYKAVQQAYHMLEDLHEGTLPHPSDSLLKFYTQYVIEGERWADLKDTMNEWGIT